MRVFFGAQLKNILIKRTQSTYFFCGYFKKFSERNPFRTKDPFKKKSYVAPFVIESDSRNASRICITILGNAGIGQPRCIGLFTEFKG